MVHPKLPIAIMGFLAFGGPAHTNPQQDRAACGGQHSDDRIAVCTRVLAEPDAPTADRAMAHGLRAFTYLARNDHDRAIADFTAGIGLNPASPELFYGRGNAQYAKRGLDPAIADYGEAIRLFPRHALAHFNRGNAHRLKGNRPRAIADLNEAIRLNPQLAAAYFNRGRIYRELGDEARATADQNEAIRLDPFFATVPPPTPAPRN